MLSVHSAGTQPLGVHQEIDPTSASYTPPTEIAEGTQAGKAIPPSNPSLPEATTTAMPKVSRSLIAFVVTEPVQGKAIGFACSVPSDRLKLTARILCVAWLVITQSNAVSTSANEPLPEASKTLIATMPASGATPLPATTPPDVTTPLTLVPWPESSSAAPTPLMVPLPFGQQPEAGLGDPAHQQRSSRRSSARSGWSVSIPESMTATLTPAPEKPDAAALSAPMSATPWARAAIASRSA